MPKIFDVFPFFNELNLLEIRLETLDEFVDYFVISEACESFSGVPKDSIYLSNLDLFKKFNHKIIHAWIDQIPSNLSPFEREWFQRNSMKSILQERAQGEDLVVFGDVDEIPSPEVLKYAQIHDFNRSPIIHCAQDLFYYYLNLKEVSGTLLSYTGEYPFVFRKKWLGTTISEFKYINSFEFSTFRDPSKKSVGTRFKNGGWHFSFVGEASNLGVEDRIKSKIQSYAHQEYNNHEIISSILQNVNSKSDLFGRRKSKFKRVKSTSNLPAFIQDNLPKYAGILLP